MKSLKKQFKIIAEKYILLFSQKHELVFEYWAADRIGEVAVFGDYYFDYNQIRFDIDTKQPEENMFLWYDLSLEKGMKNEAFMNYENYCKAKNK